MFTRILDPAILSTKDESIFNRCRTGTVNEFSSDNRIFLTHDSPSGAVIESCPIRTQQRERRRRVRVYSSAVTLIGNKRIRCLKNAGVYERDCKGPAIECSAPQCAKSLSMRYILLIRQAFGGERTQARDQRLYVCKAELEGGKHPT